MVPEDLFSFNSLWFFPTGARTYDLTHTLILRALDRSNKYKFYNLWFDPIGILIHDLPHSGVFTYKRLYLSGFPDT
jgi:hypothetical protein